MHVSLFHYSDVIMGTMVSQITSLNIVYSTVYSGADQRKHQSSASLAFVRGIHRWPVNSPHKGPATWKCFHLMMLSWKRNHNVNKIIGELMNHNDVMKLKPISALLVLECGNPPVDHTHKGPLIRWIFFLLVVSLKTLLTNQFIFQLFEALTVIYTCYVYLKLVIDVHTGIVQIAMRVLKCEKRHW